MELFIKGKRAIEDAYLRQHIKGLVNRFYLLHGLDVKQVEHLTMKELVELLEQFVQVQETQVTALQKELKSKNEYIQESDKEKSALAAENSKLEKRNVNLYVRNEQLIRDVAELKLENNHEVLRGLDGELNMEQQKHMSNLLRCNTPDEAKNEVINYFDKKNSITQKYEKHNAEVATKGISLSISE